MITFRARDHSTNMSFYVRDLENHSYFKNIMYRSISVLVSSSNFLTVTQRRSRVRLLGNRVNGLMVIGGLQFQWFLLRADSMFAC